MKLIKWIPYKLRNIKNLSIQIHRRLYRSQASLTYMQPPLDDAQAQETDTDQRVFHS